jgi:phosphoglycolate phosphatase-like HAD superfamily hydrolase
MKTIVFDIDGTLLDSNDIDSTLYLAAVRAVLGEVEFRPDWSDYEHVTDQGLLIDVLLDNGLVPDDALIQQVKETFLQSVAAHLQAQGQFKEIPGARTFIDSLHQDGETSIAYATGGWGESARLKLQTAGFPVEDIPLASSDFHLKRIDIMRHSVSQLPNPEAPVTYFGDAVWDQRACDELGWRFVAVGPSLAGIETFDLAVLHNDQISEN